MINFSNYDLVVCGLSGGKDSQAAATWLRFDSDCPPSKLRFIFCDTGNEHQLTYDHIKQIETWLMLPVVSIRNELDFYQLAEKKKRFPSAKARFCTQYLKMQVTQKFILDYMNQGKKVLMVSGTRRSESLARSNLLAFAFDNYYACDIFRPIVDWTTSQVFSYLKSKAQFANPLYSYGALRVGCFPCIMSRKFEIRMIADHFPERIDLIRFYENKIGSSFYPKKMTPARFRKSIFSRNDQSFEIASIDDVVEWSKTSWGGNEFVSGPQLSFDLSFPTCINNSGSCE